MTNFLVPLQPFTFAFLASGEMAIAYFLAHFPAGIWPVSRGVPPVLFCFALLFIAANGSGMWSVDRALRKHPANRKRSP